MPHFHSFLGTFLPTHAHPLRARQSNQFYIKETSVHLPFSLLCRRYLRSLVRQPTPLYTPGQTRRQLLLIGGCASPKQARIKVVCAALVLLTPACTPQDQDCAFILWPGVGALATRRERSTAQRWLALARLLESGKKRGACREERALGLAGGLGCRWAEVQGVGEGRRLRGGEGGKLVVVVYAVVLEESLEGDRERGEILCTAKLFIEIAALGGCVPHAQLPKYIHTYTK